MSISKPPKLQLCPYPHLSNHFMANSKPSKLCFFGLFLFSENYGYFQRSYSNLAFMSISIWLSPNYIFPNNYGYFHMPFYTDPSQTSTAPPQGNRWRHLHRCHQLVFFSETACLVYLHLLVSLGASTVRC